MITAPILTALLAVVPAALATAPPAYPNFNLQWKSDFGGKEGSFPDEGNWNIITGNLGVNNELETYARSTDNVRISKSKTLELIPRHKNNKWTSGRLESKHTFTPAADKLTRVEASIHLATVGGKQGIWPAFWMLGDSIRHGTSWPLCGELDILETVNGQSTGHGTMHCDRSPGGICGEGNGIGSPVGFNPNGFTTWRLELDRRPKDWKKQTITWFMNGKQYQQISGARINNADIWSRVCHSPLFFILNVAVGGNWVRILSLVLLAFVLC